MAATQKTLENDGDVEAFLDAVEPAQRRTDARTLLGLMERATGQPARMWGTAIVGFGRYHYRYASGHEGDAAAAAFSPRKANLTVYFPAGFEQEYAADLARLGPHTTSVSCLYLKRLDGVDLDVLEDMVRRAYALVSQGWPPTS